MEMEMEMEMRLLMLAVLQFVACAVGVWDDGEWRLVEKKCGGQSLSVANGKLMEAVLEKSAMNMDIVSRNGYYRGTSISESVEMMGQCEADLDACQCLQCFTHAILQCPASLSAQIHLNYCFVSYLFHPNSFPTPTGLNNNSGSTKRIAAIAVGAAVAVCLALIFLLFLGSRYSKRDYYY